MAPKVMKSTNRVRRTWPERLLGYKRMFETEITDGEHTARSLAAVGATCLGS